MNIIDFMLELLGTPFSVNQLSIYYIVGAIILLVLIDGIITFIISGISSLTMRVKNNG